MRYSSIFAICVYVVGCFSQTLCFAEAPDHVSVLKEIVSLARKITGAPGAEKRYAAQNCVAGGPPRDSPLWQSVLADYKGLPVLDCSPTRSSPGAPGGLLTGRALLLLPSAEQVAEWIVSACEAQRMAGKTLQSCARRVLDHVNDQNGLQFVLSGVIHEPKKFGFSKADWAAKKCASTKDDEVLYSFRDGITVRLEGQSRTSFRSGPEDGCRPQQPSDLESLLTANPAKVANYGRVAGIPRQLYSACARKPPLSDDAWRLIVRSTVIEAWSSTRYALMDAVAQAFVAPAGDCNINGD